MNHKTATKKCLPLLGIIAFSAMNAQAQTSTGIGTTTPNASAILDVSSANKGVLLPRVALQSSTDATTIASPAPSLLVYNTGAAIPAGPGYYYNAGTITAPLWTRLAGVIGSSAPVTGQTIIWNGTTYVAGNPSITVAQGTPISGNGTPASPLTINTAAAVYNASTIQGAAVNATMPTNGQVLLYNSTTNQYVPSTVPGDNWGTQVAITSGAALSGNGTVSAPLMVNNASPIFNANQLNSTTLTGTPATGQSIIYNGTNYVPGNPVITTGGTTFTGNGTPGAPLTFNGISTTGAPLSGNGTAALPLSINTSSAVYNANNIQGKAVSTTAPTTNQVLVYNGTSYVPGAVNAAQIQGSTVSNTTPTNGQVLLYNSATNQYVPSAVPGDNWGTQVVATSGTALSGNGTSTAPLTVNNTSPIFNANQLNNVVLSGTPTSGQAIVYNGTNYVPGTPVINAGSGITGNGSTASPLAFGGISTTGAPLSGNGTAASPLSINTSSAVYNANNIQGKAVSTTAPTTNQVLVYNGTSYVPGAVNAAQIQGSTVSNTTPTNGQVLLYNSATNQYVPSAVPGDNWGTQVVATSGAALSGNGTATTPLTVNNTSPIFNANQLNSTTLTGTPATGQSIIYNGTNYVPGNPVITTGGTTFTGNGTPGAPLTFNGISTTGAPLSGNGTAASPLSINTSSAVYNANNIQGKAVSTTAPTTNQVLVYNGTSYVPGAVNAAQIQGSSVSTAGPANGQALVWNSTTNQYTPVAIASGASNGLSLNGNTIILGGGLTQNTTITTSASRLLSVAGGTTTTTFDAAGNVGIGTNTPSNLLDIKGTDPLRLEGVATGYGNVLVLDGNGVVKQLPASSTFHYSVANTAGVSISQSNQTGPVAYSQSSSPSGSIPGGGSWTAVPGLTKTISIGSGTNTVSFNCEGVTQYDGTLNTSSFVSYSIGIFIDGTLQATRSFTMVGAGSVAQFDTWQASGQMMNMGAGTHTFAVYVTRRNSNSSGSGDLYFCGAVPTSTSTNTNNFMNRGVLFINGSY